MILLLIMRGRRGQHPGRGLIQNQPAAGPSGLPIGDARALAFYLVVTDLCQLLLKAM
jgi:hypothetical protein